MKKVIALLIAVVLVVALFAGCAQKGGASALVGTWAFEYEGLGEIMTFTFNKDGTGVMDALGEAIEFTYTADSSTIKMTLEGENDTVPYTIEGDILTLDIDGDVIELTKK